MFFYKDVPSRHTRQAIRLIFPPTITSPQKLFKPNKPKEFLSFWDMKVLGWFTNIGLREHSSGSVVFDMALYYTQYEHTKFQ